MFSDFFLHISTLSPSTAGMHTSVSCVQASDCGSIRFHVSRGRLNQFGLKGAEELFGIDLFDFPLPSSSFPPLHPWLFSTWMFTSSRIRLLYFLECFGELKGDHQVDCLSSSAVLSSHSFTKDILLYPIDAFRCQWS